MDPANGRRLERALQRHSDAALIERLPGRHTVVRRDQILATSDHLAMLDEALGRWAVRREDTGGSARYHLRREAQVDIAELVAELRSSRGRGHHDVSPNHLMHGEPAWWGGPSGVPHPAPPLPAPAAASASGQRTPTVAVLDTGLFPHPWFEDREWYAEQRGVGIAEVLDSNLDYELDNQAGHGTFVAGLVLQHAPGARLLIHRLLGSDGICDEFDLVRALHRLAEHRDAHGQAVDVVNLSLGCYTFDDAPTPAVQRAVERLGGTVVVACAGNDAGDRPFWPAALPGVIGVAALDPSGHHRAPFSNHGTWVDACAVGADVHSSFVVFDGPRPQVDGTDPDRFDGYARWSGTSFATPAVAGAVAACSQARGIPAAEAARFLLDPGTARILDDLGAVVTG